MLWRTRQNARLDVEKRLPDGSHLSRLYASASERRKRRKGIPVRVVDYRLKDVKDAEPIYRLITTILDHEKAPAKELAALYHERWEIETALDELKTHLRGAQIARSLRIASQPVEPSVCIEQRHYKIHVPPLLPV